MADHALATVTNPTSALTDFTLIVDLSTMPASWWSAVTSSDGTRGRVYKGDGTTRLAADWIDFDDTAETGLLRVLWSGTLATTGTQQLWIEPPVTGNAAVAASDTYGSDNAYDANWEGYWPEGGGADRTSNGRDGVANGGVTVGGVAGQIGTATLFEGTDDYVNLGAISAFGIEAAHTILTWAYPTRGDEEIEDAVASGTGTGDVLFQANKLGQSKAHFNTGGGLVSVIYTGATLLLNTWDMIGQVYDGSNLHAYLNKASASTALTGTPAASSNNLTIASRGGASPFAQGRLGEVQVHSTDRSADWISSEYDQTNDNATFWGTWSWETSGGGTTYSVSASDGISLSDSPSGALTITASASDGVSLADSPSGALRITASVSDGVSFADSSGGASTIPLTVADAIVLSDEVLTAFTFGVQVSDGVTLSDQATEGGVIQVTVSDSITFSDSASAVLRILQTISDGVVFSDEASAVATIRATVSDGVTFSDAVTTALRVVASVSDGVTLSDVAIDSTFLPVGRVQITVTTKQASVTITAKQPGVSVAFE